MKQCAYCGRDESKVTFMGVEHVVPQLMGVFSAVIVDLVCDDCNSKTFSKLETKFKEDTHEGIFYQMFNFENKYELRILRNWAKPSFAWGLGNKMFDQMFPGLQLVDGDIKFVVRPQILVKTHGKAGYIILLLDGLKKLNQSGSKFKKLKKRLDGTPSKNVLVFAYAKDGADDDQLREALEFVKALGIDYKEGNREHARFKEDGEHRAESSIDVTVGNDVGRVIAKIAFNYFIYCAVGSGEQSILFHPNFLKLKSYILGKIDPPIKEVITNVTHESNIVSAKLTPLRLLGHILTFREENGRIIAVISLLGQNFYTVDLGEMPDELKRKNFGSGHVFNPVNGKILGLTQNRAKMGSGLEQSAGLFSAL